MLNLFRWIHIIAGSVALISLWIPIFTKKGGLIHRRAGWTFVVAMGLTAVAAWAVCIMRLLDSEPGNDPIAIFLAFIALLSVNNVFVGIRVLRKKSVSDKANLSDIGISFLLLIASIALATYAAPKKIILFLAFSSLGLIISVRQLRFWLKIPRTKMEWQSIHLANMLGACIATITAFLVVNATNLGLGTFSLFVWLMPAMIGVAVTLVWVRYYRKKFETTQIVSKT